MTRERHVLDAPGEWYVDTDCIDCSAARTVAPGLIVEGGGQSVFARQPEAEEELMMAWRARLLCPTASVRSEGHARPPDRVFPEQMTEGVYRLGYNDRSSWGAHSFLIRRPSGNVMVDAPRWTKPVMATLEAWGGLSAILLTHQDDVADAGRYAAHFKAHVWIHEADRGAAGYADQILRGREPVRIADGLLAIPVPGHTEGSVVYLYDQVFVPRRLTRMELRTERSGGVPLCLLVLVVGADQIAAALARLPVRVGVCRTWRQSAPPY
jgi:hypothetical protein